MEVKAEDAQAASAILAKEHMATTQLDGYDLSTVAAVFDAEAEQVVCPACGHSFPPADMVCPECGLAFG